MSQSIDSTDFPTSSFTTPRNLTYHYIHIPPSSESIISSLKPYILILHGFPSIPTDFRLQIQHLSSLNYPILAPYLLGYHPTSTPKDPTLYKLKDQSNDIVSLLDHLKIESPVHAIGHDWGATLLSRLEYYHPTRVSSKLAFLSIAPVPFGQPMDLDAANKMTESALGYPAFGYQRFFMDNLEDDRAAKLMEEKHARMEMLMFATDSQRMWRDYFAALGGLQKWLQRDEEVKMIEGVIEKDLARRRQTFCKVENESVAERESGAGYAGSLNWYVSLNRNFNVEDERQHTKNWQHYTTDKDVLVVLCDNDPTALPAMHTGMAESYVKTSSKQLKLQHVNSGHFVMLEEGDYVNKILDQFFEGLNL